MAKMSSVRDRQSRNADGREIDGTGHILAKGPNGCPMGPTSPEFGRSGDVVKIRGCPSQGVRVHSYHERGRPARDGLTVVLGSVSLPVAAIPLQNHRDS